MSWTEIKLGDVLNYEQPYKYTVSSTDYNDKSGIPVLTAGKSFILGYTNETDNVYSDYPVIIFDDFTTDSKFVDFPFKVKSSAMKFLKERNGDEINLKFFFAVLQSLKISVTGGDHKRRWISEFSKIKIFIPPFHEQNKIASILAEVDEAIAQTQKLITKYQRIKTGLMQDLLTKGIDAKGNIRSKAIHRFVVKNGFEVPDDWDVVELKEVLAKPLTYGIVQPGNDEPEGIYMIRSQDYSKGWNPYSTIMKVSKHIDRPYERSRVFNSDLLITVVGANVGRMAIVPLELSGANISRSVARIAIDTEVNVSLFYFHYLQSSIEKILRENTVGGAQPVLNLKELNQIKVIQPKKNEQIRIIESITSIEENLGNQIRNLHKFQSIKTGLMQDLLSGKVRVNKICL